MLVVDDAISSELLNFVLLDDEFFPKSMGDSEKLAEHINSYHEETASCYAPYMFWDGWWRSEPNTLRKKVIKELWQSNLPFRENEIIGIEYWTRTYSSGQYLDTHVDEDTFLYQDKKIFSGPAHGGIWYGVDNEDGGFLEIFTKAIADGEKNALEKENIAKYLCHEDGLERIKYKGNRFISFDAGHVPHRTTPAKSGIRQVMVMNIWTFSNPPTALSLNKFHYE